MIVFDLKCAHDHVFEAWFGSSSAFEEQRARRLVACPFCGDVAVVKALMAPNLSAKGNSRPSVLPAVAAPPSGAALTPEVMKAALQALATAQAKALEKSQWVGRTFADRARAMHAGEETATPIHGQSTKAEAIALLEEGVAVAPLLVPIVPPEALN
ncbi:DUF1178 family protein [Sphingomonas sp. PB4P5]|uniref:DUF1178 family protein n=1 Tax=Parasphingomonas puruogangriensis TaxID=3096155 RepID=UPI002FCBD319